MTRRRGRHRAAALAAALALCASLLIGCGDGPDSDDGVTTITAADLPCASLDAATGVWSSAPWPPESSAPTCGWLRFDGTTPLRIEHPLGYAPATVLLYIAFTEDGTQGTLASGDPGLIESVSDTDVVVRNRTHQRFWLRLALR